METERHGSGYFSVCVVTVELVQYFKNILRLFPGTGTVQVHPLPLCFLAAGHIALKVSSSVIHISPQQLNGKVSNGGRQRQLSKDLFSVKP